MSMMKYYNKFLLIIVAMAAMVSCVDNFDSNFNVDKPADLEKYEYLNEYDVLKSYVDRKANPNFKLGSGITVSDFLKREMVYSLACSNFDELTAGNAMKYGSIVKDDGSMDFSQVLKFVDAAKGAGLSIYGHTILWHSQQNNKYLNKLIADKEIEVDPNDANNCLHINTTEAKANTWDWQIYYEPANPLTVGVTYTLSMRIKASAAATVDFWPTDGSNVLYGLSLAASKEWSNVTLQFTPSHAFNKLQFCFGKFGGDLYFDDITLTAANSTDNVISNGTFDSKDLSNWGKPSWHSYSFNIEALAAGPSTWWKNLVSNSNCEDDDVSSFYATEVSNGPKAATFSAAGTGAGGTGRAIVVQSGDNATQDWDTQFFVKVPHVFKEGEKYRFSMKVKASRNVSIDSQAHKEPGGYLHYAMLGSPNVTTEWQEYTSSGSINSLQEGMSTIAFNLAKNKLATTFYFDDIVFEIEESGNTIPLTPEEKKEVLTNAMENWVKGMMEACGGYVKAWDVVNEPLAGVDKDGDGWYDLQSVNNVSAEDAKNNFYWQDYLGDDYVRTAIQLTRKYGPEDMKLFINDYNLESDWDDNMKLKSLINWIERWEKDGTKIDGIGTQMHVSYYLNSTTQKSKEDHIVKMFELLKASGKLIKISELDMGIIDENGNEIKTANLTFEQQLLMSEYYKFIVKKYFEIIPVSQQYGITHWSPTDSPDDSGWRKGQPIGLWSLNYNRKPVYAGFAEGLSGK